MFLFYPIHFLKFLVKSQPQRFYEKDSYIKKGVYFVCGTATLKSDHFNGQKRVKLVYITAGIEDENGRSQLQILFLDETVEIFISVFRLIFE